MQEQIPPKSKAYKDAWGTTGTREGYEDRPQHRPRQSPPKRQGSAFLRSLGALMIVGGICWGVWLFTAGGANVDVLRQNHWPAWVCGAGVVVSLLGKYIRL
jgi:hypothetical protein